MDKWNVVYMYNSMGFPGDPMVENPPTVQETWVQFLGREALEKGNGNLLQYSCWRNAMERGAWQATVHGVTKSQMWLSNWAHTLYNSIIFNLKRKKILTPAASWKNLDNIQLVSSVAQSCVTLQPHGLQSTRLPYPPPTPGIYSNSCPLSWRCHPTLSSSVIPFSSHRQSFPASGSFPVSQFFTSGGQSTGASTSASVLPMNIQGWFRLGWTGWISLQSKGLSRVFSNTTVQKHQFFGTQLS